MDIQSDALLWDAEGQAQGAVLATKTVRDVMTSSPVTVMENDPLSLLRHRMHVMGVRHLPVLRNNEVVGIVSERDVLIASNRELRSRHELTARRIMAPDVVCAAPDESLASLVTKMLALQVSAVPVVAGEVVTGIVTVMDLFAKWAPSVLPGTLVVRDLMTAEPLYADPEESITEAIRCMVDNQIRHLPVVAPDGKLIGILSDRDIRLSFGNPREVVAHPREELDYVTVGDEMTLHPAWVWETERVVRALDYFVDERVGALPVLGAESALVGIISYIDVLRHIERASFVRPV